MHLELISLVAVFYSIIGHIHADSFETSLFHSDCQTLCSASGGHFEFDGDACKCVLKKHVDDMDIALIHKNAKFMGKKLVFLEVLNDTTIIFKSDNNGHNPVPLQITSTEKNFLDASEVKTTESSTPSSLPSADPKPVEVVGLKKPHFFKHPKHAVPQRRNNDWRPNCTDQQRAIIAQINGQLNLLCQFADQRLKKLEIEGIENNLKQLSQSLETETPQQRSRIRDAIEKRQQKQKLVKPKAVLGATLHQKEEGSNKKEGHVKFPHFDIITQDPKLVDG